MPWTNIDKGHVVGSVRFNIPRLLESIAGYKGFPFPAPFLGRVNSKVGVASGSDYQVTDGASAAQDYAANGAVLRKRDLFGHYYFMPIAFSANGQDYEIDCALVSINQKKTIVKTPLVGQRGTVKELINCEDLQIDIVGCLISTEKGVWPEERINGLRDLFEVNDAVSLKCALTDCFFDDDDKVVIEEVSWPAAEQVEDVVPVTIKCVSDTVFELNLQ